MTKNDILTINAILSVIAKDETLIEQFAQAIGQDPIEFGDWIEVVQVK
jgi:hypothetical protein